MAQNDQLPDKHMKKLRVTWSIKRQLLTKAKESALCAIKVFNDPLVHFKSESFIVLMIIAWTYLLHAYFRGHGIDYRYFHLVNKRKRYETTKDGLKKHWELERCLNEKSCPIDPVTSTNLRFLIGLRHAIEHQMAMGLDSHLSGRYQACAFNFNHYLKTLFGAEEGLDEHLAYSLQFAELDFDQISKAPTTDKIPTHLRSFISDFDAALTHEQYNDSRFSFRLLFKKKLVNRPGQADRVVEFIDPNSELAKTIDKEFWVKKEVERTKYRPKRVVAEVRKAGFPKFRIQPDHVDMWKTEDAKNPAKGYGTNVEAQWYWYDSWIKRCIKLCGAEGKKFK